jgi:hypothetical protein
MCELAKGNGEVKPEKESKYRSGKQCEIELLLA